MSEFDYKKVILAGENISINIDEMVEKYEQELTQNLEKMVEDYKAGLQKSSSTYSIVANQYRDLLLYIQAKCNEFGLSYEHIDNDEFVFSKKYTSDPKFNFIVIVSLEENEMGLTARFCYKNNMLLEKYTMMRGIDIDIPHIDRFFDEFNKLYKGFMDLKVCCMRSNIDMRGTKLSTSYSYYNLILEKDNKKVEIDFNHNTIKSVFDADISTDGFLDTLFNAFNISKEE